MCVLFGPLSESQKKRHKCISYRQDTSDLFLFFVGCLFNLSYLWVSEKCACVKWFFFLCVKSFLFSFPRTITNIQKNTYTRTHRKMLKQDVSLFYYKGGKERERDKHKERQALLVKNRSSSVVLLPLASHWTKGRTWGKKIKNESEFNKHT